MTSKIIHFRDFVEEDFRIVEKIVKVKKSKEFPNGLKYSFNLMVFDNKWISLVRVDNSVHKKDRIGQHLHRFDKGIENAGYSINLELKEIKKHILKIAKEIKGW